MIARNRHAVIIVLRILLTLQLLSVCLLLVTAINTVNFVVALVQAPITYVTYIGVARKKPLGLI